MALAAPREPINIEAVLPQVRSLFEVSPLHYSVLSIRNTSYDAPETVALCINSMPRSCFQQVLGILGFSGRAESSQPSVPGVRGVANPTVGREEQYKEFE